MNNLPNRCPICAGEIEVTRFRCQECDTSLEGRFLPSPFNALTTEQLNFLLVFIRSEGKFSRMEAEIGQSYPTMRNRLHEIIRQMGYEPGEMEDSAAPSVDVRQRVLDDLDQGRISADQAMKLLLEG
jgi:hypothetical protein